MDKVKVVMNELNTKLTLAKIANQSEIRMPVCLIQTILLMLKEQEEQIWQLTEELEELRNKRNEVYYSGYDGSFIL